MPGQDHNDQIPAEVTSWASSVANRKSMQANRRRDTSAELRVRRLLHAQGLRYRVDYSLPFDRRRKCDIAFTTVRVAVFIDGCFWHGCSEHYSAPQANAEFWADKIGRNRLRDLDSTRRLEAEGWTVLRFWEHEDPQSVVRTITSTVRAMRET